MKIKWYAVISWSLILFTLGFVYGVISYAPQKSIGENSKSGIQEDISQTANKSNSSDLSTPAIKVVDPNAIKSGALLIYETKYKVCGHVIKQQMVMPSDLVGLSKVNMSQTYTDWKIKEYSPLKVMLYKEEEGKCASHYIIKDRNGLVAVYYQVPIDGIDLKQVTQIQTANLREGDQAHIKSGIMIESDEELANVLEDLGS
jgi:hypothetical protein